MFSAVASLTIGIAALMDIVPMHVFAIAAFQMLCIPALICMISSSIDVLVSTGAIPIASLPINTLVPLDVARAAPYVTKRYVGLRYVVVGTATTAGTYFAGFVADMQDVKNTVFSSGFAVA